MVDATNGPTDPTLDGCKPETEEPGFAGIAGACAAIQCDTEEWNARINRNEAARCAAQALSSTNGVTAKRFITLAVAIEDYLAGTQSSLDVTY